MLGLLFLSALIVAVCLAPFFWFCYKFGPGIQKGYDDTVDSLAEKIAPPPANARKQQEVYDFYMNILCTGQNTRGEYVCFVMQELQCTRPIAFMYMLEHDCQDAGIEMNRAYAMDLCGLYH